MNEIPEMTNPLGKAWEQPKRENIRLDDENAYIRKADFDLLKQYDTSNPSGVYAGKMWKRSVGGDNYILCWWVDVPDKEGYCKVNYRKILLQWKEEIQTIVLIQRDGGAEYQLEHISLMNCRLEKVGGGGSINLPLYHLINALNTPKGAWSLKYPDSMKYAFEGEVWVRGKLLSENGREESDMGRVEDIIEINEMGHPRELSIRRRNYIRKHTLLG